MSIDDYQVVKLVTEEILHSVFDQYQNVTDVSIKKVVTDQVRRISVVPILFSSLIWNTHLALHQAQNTQSGYGFVHFAPNQAGIASAFQALSVVNNSTIDEVTYSVEASKNLLKQFKEESAQPAKPTHTRQKSGDSSHSKSPVPSRPAPSHDRSRSHTDLPVTGMIPSPVHGPMHGRYPAAAAYSRSSPASGTQGAHPQRYPITSNPTSPYSMHASSGTPSPAHMLPSSAGSGHYLPAAGLQPPVSGPMQSRGSGGAQYPRFSAAPGRMTQPSQSPYPTSRAMPAYVHGAYVDPRSAGTSGTSHAAPRPVNQLTGHTPSMHPRFASEHQQKSNRQEAGALYTHNHPVAAAHGHLVPAPHLPAQLHAPNQFHQAPVQHAVPQYTTSRDPSLSPPRLNLQNIPAPIQITGYPGHAGSCYHDMLPAVQQQTGAWPLTTQDTGKNTPGSGSNRSTHCPSYSTASTPTMNTIVSSASSSRHESLSARSGTSAWSPRAGDGLSFTPRDSTLTEVSSEEQFGMRPGLSLSQDEDGGARPSLILPPQSEATIANGLLESEPVTKLVLQEGFSRPPAPMRHAARPQELNLDYLSINRSCSSEGLPAPPRSSVTHATTDSEGGFFGSASSSFVTETTSVYAHSSSFLSSSFPGINVPPTPSSVAPRLSTHKEASFESDSGHRLTRRSLLLRHLSSSASLLSDADAELVEDEYTYSGSNSQSDVLAAYERDLSSRETSGHGSENENTSFYTPFPNVDTTFLETPASSTQSLKSQLLDSHSGSGSSDLSSTRVVGAWLQVNNSKQVTPDKKVRSHSGSLSDGSPPRETMGVALTGVSPPPVTLPQAPREDSGNDDAEAAKPVSKARQRALTEFFKPVRQRGPK
jgi:hypothetical protein